MRWLDGITNSIDRVRVAPGVGDGNPGVLQSMGS